MSLWPDLKFRARVLQGRKRKVGLRASSRESNSLFGSRKKILGIGRMFS